MASAGSGYSHTFVWPHTGPSHVVVTGTFDDWKSSVTLHKDETGGFSATVDLPYDSQILYKYVVDGSWVTEQSQEVQHDGSGNVNNVLNTPAKSAATSGAATSAHSGEPAAPLKAVADSTEAPNTEPITETVAAAVGAVAVAGTAAVAAVSSALGFETAKSTDKTAEGAPINDVSSLPVPAPSEKPAEPAPSPVPPRDTKAQHSLPTVPSEQDVRDAVGTDGSDGPMLTGLAPVDERTTGDTTLNSVQASGKGASTAGPADGAPSLRLAEVGAATTALAGGAAAVTASKGRESLPAAVSGSNHLGPVKGVEVYKADGSVGKDANVAIPGVAAAATGASAVAGAEKKADAGAQADNGIKAHNPVTGALEPATGPQAVTAAPTPKETPKKVSRKEPPAPAKAAPVTPKKEEPKDNGKYGGLGHSKDASKASTVSKKSAVGADSLPNTPAKEDYKTAPSTPAVDTPQGLRPGGNQIPRTTSFFGKLKASLSPTKKK